MKSLIIIGPSGVGKGTIIKRILEKHPIFEFTMSFTTRKIRPNEKEGKDYYFVSPQAFQQKIRDKQMLQYKKVFNNYYGTSKQSYFNTLQRNKIPLLDIDVEGMLDIKQSILQSKLEHKHLQSPDVICIMPPSWQVIRNRLIKRSSQSEEIIDQRMQENVLQYQKMKQLKEKDIFFLTNYQYQLSVYGIELFLVKRFHIFKENYLQSKFDSKILHSLER